MESEEFSKMIEFVLLLVIVALCGLIGWMDWNNRKERKSLFNAIMSKNTEDLINLEAVDKITDKEEPKEELTSFDDLDDGEFDQFVLRKDK